MGNWLHNYHVKTRAWAAVRDQMERLAELDARVSRPKHGWVTVFEQAGGEAEARQRIAAELSGVLETVVLSWTIVDDDVTVIDLWDRGSRVARFDSCPEYFGGEVDDSTWGETDGAPAKLVPYCVPGTSSDALEDALVRARGAEADSPFTFETDRVAVLAPLFGIDRLRASASFESLMGSSQLARQVRGTQPPPKIVGRRVREIDPRAREVTDRLVHHDYATVSRWLDEGLDPNARDEHGTRIFESVLSFANRQLLWKFIDRGADARGALALFVLRRDSEQVRRLLSRGVEVDATSAAGYTALWHAVSDGNLEMVELLLAWGADVNRRCDLNHRAPPSQIRNVRVLMCAARYGNPAIVERLLRAGADVNARDARGLSALVFAEEGGHREVAELLRAAGATGAAPSGS